LPQKHTTTQKKHQKNSADTGPLWDGGRVSITPLAATDQQPHKTLLCSFHPPTTLGYPYYSLKTTTSHRIYVMQLALPASWSHGRVGRVARLLGEGGGEGVEGMVSAAAASSSSSSEEQRRVFVAKAGGGWREVVAAVGKEDEGGVGDIGGRWVSDGWAWDEEEQDTLWLRVSSKRDGGAVRVVLSFDDE
jgi:hypothetical protein